MVQIVRDNKLRAVLDGELFTADTAAELVHLLNVTTRFRDEDDDPSDADFMRGCSERAYMLHDAKLEGGGVIRYDTPENFISDLHDAGMLRCSSAR
jgi:hypothetical protein